MYVLPSCKKSIYYHHGTIPLIIIKTEGHLSPSMDKGLHHQMERTFIFFKGWIFIVLMEKDPLFSSRKKGICCLQVIWTFIIIKGKEHYFHQGERILSSRGKDIYSYQGIESFIAIETNRSFC